MYRSLRATSLVPRLARSLRVQPTVGSVSSIRFISNTNKNLADDAAVQAHTPHKPDTDNYLDTLNTSELLGYGVIGMCTLSKPVLNMAIRAFPYTPLWMIRLLVYKNYCGGDTLPEVMKTGERLSERGIRNMMVSYTVEACDGKKMSVSIETIVGETKRSISELLVPHTVKMIQEAGIANINDIPPGYVALKPTGLIESAADILLHYQEPAYKGRYEQLVETCSEIIKVAEDSNLTLHKQFPGRKAPFIVAIVDAERNDLQQGVYKLQRDLFARFNKVEPTVVGTMQMYLKESTPNLAKEDKLARQGGYLLGWKLVRGAYIHTEPNRAVIHDTKADTDANYDSGIQNALANMSSEKPSVGHLVVASHNPNTQKMATDLLEKVSDKAVKANVVLGQLLGMGDNITYYLTKHRDVKNIIKYVPWGPPLETKEYLLRRLEENGDAVRADSGWPLVKGVAKTLWKRAF
ncbi:DEKNAAC103497 [Brettanomyces naardenensis]|uniref:Proline dehydrogenase n=1 Tax=Brettanomyces naardenensis TaxID=13370 RepID=A0A448YNG0_BRENA|nr:DEKNAAC103497 [Brettanomyces naardenensis]